VAESIRSLIRVYEICGIDLAELTKFCECTAVPRVRAVVSADVCGVD